MHVLNIEKRKEICTRCPIYNPVNGRCNNNLWINPENDDVSTKPKAGYIRGCNCFVDIKMRNLNNHCVAGKW